MWGYPGIPGADYATGRADRNLKWGERCATGTPGGPVGYCPAVSGSVAVKEGVDAGGRGLPSQPEVLDALGGARECPYTAHVRMLSGSGGPHGIRGRSGGSGGLTSRTCAIRRGHPNQVPMFPSVAMI